MKKGRVPFGREPPRCTRLEPRPARKRYAQTGLSSVPPLNLTLLQHHDHSFRPLESASDSTIAHRTARSNAAERPGALGGPSVRGTLRCAHEPPTQLVLHSGRGTGLIKPWVPHADEARDGSIGETA
jgi:hypothetical protein